MRPSRSDGNARVTPVGRRRWVALSLAAAGLVAACQLDELLRAPNQGPASTGPGTGTAVRLVFTVQPGATPAGAAISPAVQITAVDQGGGPAPSFTGIVTLSLADNPGGATLSGTTTRAASQGVAVFSGLTLSQPGGGYRLGATGAGLQPATSQAFEVTRPGPQDLDDVSGNGQTDTVAASLAPYVVRVTDEEGAPVAGVTVLWSVDDARGSVNPSSVVTGPTGEAAAVHTLGTITGRYSVSASVAELPGRSVTFSSDARHGNAIRLLFSQQPTDANRQEDISPPVRVTVQDQFGNTATGYGSLVTMNLTPGSGTPGARLEGDRTRAPNDGVATFDNLRITEAGFWFRLRATAPGNLLEDSAPFHVFLVQNDDDDDDLVLGELTAHLDRLVPVGLGAR
jgi:hypothetical protein